MSCCLRSRKTCNDVNIRQSSCLRAAQARQSSITRDASAQGGTTSAGCVPALKPTRPRLVAIASSSGSNGARSIVSRAVAGLKLAGTLRVSELVQTLRTGAAALAVLAIVTSFGLNWKAIAPRTSAGVQLAAVGLVPILNAAAWVLAPVLVFPVWYVALLASAAGHVPQQRVVPVPAVEVVAAEVPDQAVVRLLANRAGVENDEVGVVGRRGDQRIGGQATACAGSTSWPSCAWRWARRAAARPAR